MRNEWPRLPFSEVVDINPKRALNKGQVVPFIEMAALPTSGPKIQYVEQRIFGNGGSRFANGDTLFARITPCAENGKVGFVDCLPPGQVGLGSTEFVVFGPKDGTTDPKYVYHLARSDIIRKPALGRMIGTTGRQRVPNSVFGEIKVGIPPVPEQRRIAEILSSVDEAIQTTQAVIEQTGKVKQGVLKCLLSKGIGHTRFKTTEFGEIPEDWEVVPLQTVAAVRTGLAKGKKGLTDAVELPYLRVANVQDGYIDLTELKTISVPESQVERYSLQAGDVLMTEGGDFDKLGRGDVWRGQISPCLHQNHVFAVRPNQDVLIPEYLAALTSSLHGKTYFLNCSKRTTNLASINSTQVKDFPVLLPPRSEQEQIVRRLEAISQAEQLSRRELASLERSKSALMCDLLTGRKRVTTDLLMAAE